MHNARVIAYLTSAYGRTSDSFIRDEVNQLRALGSIVYTFSIRRPDESQAVSKDILRERSQTEYLLVRQNIVPLISSVLKTSCRRPVRLLRAILLAARCSSPGVKSRIWALAYVIEACLLAERLRLKAVNHLHNHFGDGCATVAMLTGLLLGIPYSLTIHGAGEFDQPKSLALDEKIARASFVVTVSDWGRSQLLRWCRPEHGEKITVIRCGVGEHFVEQTSIPASRSPRLIYVGRLERDKGVLILLDAVAQLVEKQVAVELVIVGDGSIRGEVEQLIRRKGLGRYVTIRGWLSSAAVREEILRARAFVLPSFTENLPVSIMEAMALERPVVSSQLGGIPELVGPGVGWLVPPGSAPALAEALRQAVTAPPEQMEKMGKAAAALVAARHNSRVEGAKLARLFANGGSAQEQQVVVEAMSRQQQAIR